MKISKKILAVLLTALMVFSLVPLSAFATEWNIQDFEITQLQQGDSITSDVEYIDGFYGYEVRLLANGYQEQGSVRNYDTVGSEMGFRFGEIDQRFLPYGSDKWYVIAVDHDAQTIILSGDADATPATTYTATWKNYNGTVLRTDTNLEEGTTPTYFGKMPAKPSTDTHFYAFSGWTPAVAPIATDAIYTATFTEMAKSSTVDGCETFVTKSSTSEKTFSGDHFSVTNSVIALDTGCMANTNSKTTVSALNGEKITKLVLTRASGNNIAPVVYVNGTAVSGTQSGDVFTFDNLNATSVQIGTDSSSWTKTAELVAYYKEAGTSYTVTWKNADGTVLETDTDVAEGTVPTYDKATPTKADDAQYTYTFAGWSPAVTAVSGDVTYTATYTATELDVLPTVTAVDSTAEGYDTAYEYTYANDGSAKYATYYGDITVSFDRAIEADDVVLAGAYDNYNGGAWNVVPLRALAAGEEFRIVKEGLVGQPVTFAKLLAITGGDFRCAAKGTDVSGVTMTVKFNLYETKTSTEPIEIASSIKTYTFPEVTDVANNGVSLTLGEDITSNYYVDYQAYEGAYEIEYTYNSISENERQELETKSVYLDNIPASMLEGGRVKITVSQAPAQMGELTEIKILNEASDVLDTLHYSSKTYCDNIIAMDDDALAEYAGTAEKAAQLKTLCNTIIAYGYAAQGVFADYETTAITTADFSTAVKNQIDAAYCYAEHSVNNSGAVKFKSASFACTKDARLRFYLDTAAATGKPAAPKEVNGHAATLKYVVNEGVKVYYIEVSGIDAVDFDQKMEVSYGGSSISCSVLDFCGLAFTHGDTPVQNLARTLIVYNQNAEAYFG